VTNYSFLSVWSPPHVYGGLSPSVKLLRLTKLVLFRSVPTFPAGSREDKAPLRLHPFFPSFSLLPIREALPPSPLLASAAFLFFFSPLPLHKYGARAGEVSFFCLGIRFRICLFSFPFLPCLQMWIVEKILEGFSPPLPFFRWDVGANCRTPSPSPLFLHDLRMREICISFFPLAGPRARKGASRHNLFFPLRGRRVAFLPPPPFFFSVVGQGALPSSFSFFFLGTKGDGAGHLFFSFPGLVKDQLLPLVRVCKRWRLPLSFPPPSRVYRNRKLDNLSLPLLELCDDLERSSFFFLPPFFFCFFFDVARHLLQLFWVVLSPFFLSVPRQGEPLTTWPPPGVGRAFLFFP